MSQISYSSMAKTAAQALQDDFYNEDFGLYCEPKDNPENNKWWLSAVALEGIIDYMSLTKGTPYFIDYSTVISNTFKQAPVYQQSVSLPYLGPFLNNNYDDEGWWAITWIKAHDYLKGGTQYIDMAADKIFPDMIKGWDTKTCGGGIWWNKDPKYKAAIQNELFLVVAARLHLRLPETNPKGFNTWAGKEWNWFKNTGMINTNNLVNNGLTPQTGASDCTNDGGTTWTYNQGVILGGLVDLYQITKDRELLAQAQAIAQTAIYTLCYANGVLQEPCEPANTCNEDQQSFKGIFMRYLAYLHTNLKMLDSSTLEAVKAETLKFDLPQELQEINAPGYDTLSYYENCITLNAKSIWNNAIDQGNKFGSMWVGPYDHNNVATQASALAAFNAAIPFD